MSVTERPILPNPSSQLSLWKETGVPGEICFFPMRSEFESHWEDFTGIEPAISRASGVVILPPKLHLEA